MADRIGPTLTLAGRCDGCPWLRLDVTVWRCANQKASSVAEPMICSAHREPRAPAWCPELPGARLAMAREIVAEAPPSKADDRWYGGFIAALATIARYPAGMTAKGIMQDHGVTIADLRDSQQGVPQEIDDIEASR